MTEGNTWKARTKPIEGVPSSNASPGPRARGPNKNIEPLWDAPSRAIRRSLIHSNTVLDPENQNVKAPNAHAREMLPIIVTIFMSQIF